MCITLAIRAFYFIGVIITIACAQLYPYRDCFFPAWGFTYDNPSLYFGIEKVIEYKIKAINFDSGIRKFMIYADWDSVQSWRVNQ